MTKNVDAIIIGAGVIGAATAFEMAKSGLKTLSIDKNPVAGYGPTSGSCAIIRVHYSTIDGTASASPVCSRSSIKLSNPIGDRFIFQ